MAAMDPVAPASEFSVPLDEALRSDLVLVALNSGIEHLTRRRTGIDHVILMVEGAGDRARTLTNIACLGAEVLPCLRDWTQFPSLRRRDRSRLPRQVVADEPRANSAEERSLAGVEFDSLGVGGDGEAPFSGLGRSATGFRDHRRGLGASTVAGSRAPPRSLVSRTSHQL
jgi:hypothetical protein